MYLKLHSKRLLAHDISVKRTPEDDAFAAAFGALLEEAYQDSKFKKVTDQAFAESIGVERPQLRKYLRGDAVPSVRTIALAQRKYGINVPYENVQVAKALGNRPARRRSLPHPVQLRLPFSVEINDSGKVEVELKSLKPRKYELRIRVNAG